MGHNVVQVSLIPTGDIPVGPPGLSILLLLLQVWLRPDAPDLHLVDVEGGGDGGVREGMEGVDVTAGFSLAQVLVEHQAEISYKLI